MEVWRTPPLRGREEMPAKDANKEQLERQEVKERSEDRNHAMF